MKKTTEYLSVTVKFVVREREAKRVTERSARSAVRAALVAMLKEAIGGNDTNVMDCEDVSVAITW